MATAPVPLDPPADARSAATAPHRSRWREAAIALAGYLCLSAILYGHGVLGRLADAMVGTGPWASAGRDQGSFIWYIAWGARSISQLRDPLSTMAIYAPHGWNLAWATDIPGPAALLTPLTMLAGPVVSFNVLALCAPAFAAWTAYLLCRQILSIEATSTPAAIGARSGAEGTSSRGRLARLLSPGPAPAVVGGLLFGFGTYETVEMINHVNLALVGLVPLTALLVLRRHARRISRATFILALGVVLAAQMLTSTEVFATSVLFGAFAIALWAALSGAKAWRRVALTAGECLLGVLLGGVLSIPFLYQAFHFGNPARGIAGRYLNLDAANVLTSTKATLVPGIGTLFWSAHELHSNVTEQTGYLGLPLLAMLAAFAWSFRRRHAGWWLIAFMLWVGLLSLGGKALIDSRPLSFPLPWALIDKLPLMKFAAPARFTLFLWLAIAVAGCLWLAQGRRSSRNARWALLGVVLISLMPSPVSIRWSTPVDRPSLLRSSQLASYVPPRSVVLALPYGSRGNSMLWQVEAHFRFRLAGGYASIVVPPQYRRWSNLLQALGGAPFSGNLTPELCSFLRYTGTRTILLREKAPGSWRQLLRPLGITPVAVGGFHVYKLTTARTAASAGGAPAPSARSARPYESRLRCGAGGA